MISAFKPQDDLNYVSSCDLADPDAYRFEVSYPGMIYHSSTLSFDSLYVAEAVDHAILCAFEAGKKAAMAEFRKFIGVR